jgi:hypothetical protein
MTFRYDDERQATFEKRMTLVARLSAELSLPDPALVGRSRSLR